MFRVVKNLLLRSGLKHSKISTSANEKKSFKVGDVMKDLERRFNSAEIEDSETSAKYLIASLFNETNLDEFDVSKCEGSMSENQVKSFTFRMIHF